MIGFLLEALLNLVGEVLLQLLVEAAAELGWESVGQALGRRRPANPVLAGFGLVILGAATGYASTLLLPKHLFGPSRFPGISLVVAPVATGSIMQALGNWRTSNRHTHSLLATFWGGALFAFAMLAARLALV